MGRIADSLADQLVVTNDNPRSELPEMIAEDVLVGITGSPCHVELDRGAAIRHAVLNARSGDTVLVAGKGHENYQLVGKNKLDFSDVSCAAQVLREREAAQLELRLSELAQSLGVACESGDALVTGLAIDSRAVKPGDLFVAIEGEHVDGHDFIDKALGNGAAAIACTRPIDVPPHILRPLIRSRSAHTMGNSSGADSMAR